MKFSLVSILVLLFAVPVYGNPNWDLQQAADTLEINEFDHTHNDSLIRAEENIGNYREALRLSLEALNRAKVTQDKSREWICHLHVAKFYYLTGNTNEALTHFRLYALVKESEIEEIKNSEMFELESAYLEEIQNLQNEIDLDRTLITNLREENESYYRSQQQIELAIKIGSGAFILVLVILLYNRYKTVRSRKEKNLLKQDELQILSEKLGKLEEELARNDEQISKLKESRHQSLSYARNIQLSLLPTEVEREKKLGKSFVLHIPKDIISGDFYTHFSVNGKTVVGAFDCPGHSVDAAHSTVVTHNIFKEIVDQGITAPSMILTMMDQKLKHESMQLEANAEKINGVKMAICTINNETKEVEYGGAQFPLYYVHLDELHFLKGNKFPVGDPMFSDKFYSSTNLRMSSSDMIYLCSDGYSHQLGGEKGQEIPSVFSNQPTELSLRPECERTKIRS